ncbi:MAG: phosphoenolpyruvate synthase [Nanoarchaeota archaeon]|nr:phosphoenolpyruvate synthase [Nanoarchaeota archaeon]
MIKKEVTGNYIKWIYELDKSSGAIVGGKGANLAEMFNAKFPVPPAFAITTEAYKYFVKEIREKIDAILETIDVNKTKELEEKAKQIRELIIAHNLPDELKEDILEAYEDLGINKEVLETAKTDALNILQHSQEPIFVAVRSSATTEDLDDASFAGQQESYLDVKGKDELLKKVKRVFASLFTARAIYYRKKRGFSKEKFALSVIVQRMVDSDKSGVMFSTNPIKQNDSIIIEAVFGLGEGIVSGKIKPDNYEISRDLKILNKKISNKKIALTRNSQGEIEQINLKPQISESQVLKESEIIDLANLAIKIQDHYEKPQDIEFAIEGEEIYIVQSRPITTNIKTSEIEIKGEPILEGLSASPGIGSGKVKIIHNLDELDKIVQGDVLVTKMTNPDMVITMQKAAAIITDEGGITCHAAIVSREMGIPSVVGTDNATSTLKDGQEITVDGFNGKVYPGKHGQVKAEVLPIVPTKTKIKVILDLPEATERASKTKCSAIGLLRLEGIIASSGKHPLLFKQQNKLQDYTKLLEEGIEIISRPFKEIWIRTSDIRSDEYSNLEGAPSEKEANPMLGDHGIRFSLKNSGIFKAELQAIKNLADRNPDKKFGFMVPQIISVKEVEETKKIAQELKMTNVKIGIMVETPAACSIIKYILKVGIDFISFGTNDLTQYTLAIDRGNEDVQYLYDEQHPAVLNSIKRVLRTCREFDVESSLCGQAGSNKEMVRFLVENQIDSISVNADAAQEISKFVAELESNPKPSFHNKFKKQTPIPPVKKSPEQTVKEIDQKVQQEIGTQMQNMVKQKTEENKIVTPQKPTINSHSEIKEEQLPKQSKPEEKQIPSYVANMNEEVISPNQSAENEPEVPYDQYENNLLQKQIEGEPNSQRSELKNLSDNELDEVLDVF